MNVIIRLFTAFLVIAVFSSLPSWAQEPSPQQGIVAGSAYGVIGASLARSEEALCRSLVNYNFVRGAFGESVMERVVLQAGRSGEWQAISLNPTPQGIDGLYIKRDALGNPKGLIVGEAKFGKAQLGRTLLGKQLDLFYNPPRLSLEASRYISAGSSASIEMHARPRGLAQNPDVVRVRLADGRYGHFWRNRRSEAWAYDGPEGTVDAARRAAVRDGRYIQGAAEGRITYRQRLYKVDVSGDTISARIFDAKSSSPGSVSLKEINRVTINAADRMIWMREVKADIARKLMSKNPHLTEEDAKIVAAAATRKIGHLEEILRQQHRPYWVSVLSDSAKAGMAGGILAGALDVASQIYTKGDVDWEQAGVMSFIGAGSAGAGALAHHLIVASAVNNAAVNQFFVQSANLVGLPTTMAAVNIFGLGTGSAAGSVVFSALMYFAGYMEAGDAARMAAAGTTGSVVGMVAGGGLVAFATMYGTAGTGAAISSLSGAAANSAALAWLGGGTLAAGGGGMALGAIVVSGGIAIVAIATTAAISWGYAAYDDSEASHRHQYCAYSLMNDGTVVQELCRRRWFPDSNLRQ